MQQPAVRIKQLRAGGFDRRKYPWHLVGDELKLARCKHGISHLLLRRIWPELQALNPAPSSTARRCLRMNGRFAPEAAVQN